MRLLEEVRLRLACIRRTEIGQRGADTDVDDTR